MTFLAEWGDRSQITTISLAASQNVFGVTLGGCLGHFACTGAAVLGGKSLASVIEPRTVNIIGGVLFLLFGVIALYEGPGHTDEPLAPEVLLGRGGGPVLTHAL